MAIPELKLDEVAGGFLAIGNFDGVHRGHQKMVQLLHQRATAMRVAAVAMTFDPPPAAILRPDARPPSLTTISHRVELLKSYGADQVVVWPTTRDLLQLSPREFFDEVVVRRLQVCGLVEGPNFHFGRDRAGDVETLREFCGEANLDLQVVEPVMVDGELVSSSRIRQRLLEGDVDAAVRMLGHPYRLSGLVCHGAGRGDSLGFPTANLTQPQTLVPAPGVYAGVAVLDSRECPAAVSIGGNPTFDEQACKIEVHVCDWSGDLYGVILSVDLLARIRDLCAFASPSDLKQQIEQDIAVVRARCSARQTTR